MRQCHGRVNSDLTRIFRLSDFRAKFRLTIHEHALTGDVHVVRQKKKLKKRKLGTYNSNSDDDDENHNIHREGVYVLF